MPADFKTSKVNHATHSHQFMQKEREREREGE